MIKPSSCLVLRRLITCTQMASSRPHQHTHTHAYHPNNTHHDTTHPHPLDFPLRRLWRSGSRRARRCDRDPGTEESLLLRLKLSASKGSIGHAFTVCIHTENQNQVSFYPFVLHEISVLIELTLGHPRYLLTDVPPQPNSPPDNVFRLDRQQVA